MEITDEFGWRMASLADGEGHFGITKAGRNRTARKAFFIVKGREYVIWRVEVVA